MRKNILLVILMPFICQTLFSQQFLEKENHPKVFSNKAVILTDSWIKQREVLNTKYLLSLNPDRLLHNFRVNAGIESNAKPLEGWEAPYIG